VLNGEYVKPLKIIGTRYFEGKLMSQTNKGTNKEFSMLDLEKIKKYLEEGSLKLKN
jgi:hypothetical protein